MSTAVPETLYAAFQNQIQLSANSLNVSEFVSGWVAQPGYPVLNVNVSSDRKTIVISQRKFLRNNPDHQDKTLWHIPVTYASDKENTEFNETKAQSFFSEETQTIVLNEAIEWIVFNVQQTGKCFECVELKYFDLISLLTRCYDVACLSNNAKRLLIRYCLLTAAIKSMSIVNMLNTSFKSLERFLHSVHRKHLDAIANK